MALVAGSFVYAISKSLLTDGANSPYPPETLFFMIPTTIVCMKIIRVKPYYPAEYREWFEAHKRLELTKEEKCKVASSVLSYIFWCAIFFFVTDLGEAIYRNALSVRNIGIYLIVLTGVWGLRHFVRQKRI